MASETAPLMRHRHKAEHDTGGASPDKTIMDPQVTSNGHRPTHNRNLTADTLPGCLHHWADTRPDHKAFIFISSRPEARVLTCGELRDLAVVCAERLKAELGGLQDKIVCNTLLSGPERVIVDMAVLLAGGVVVDGHVPYRNSRSSPYLLHFLNETRCTAMVASDDYYPLPSADDWLTNNAPQVQLYRVVCREIDNQLKIRFPFIEGLREDLKTMADGNGQSALRNGPACMEGVQPPMHKIRDDQSCIPNDGQPSTKEDLSSTDNGGLLAAIIRTRQVRPRVILPESSDLAVIWRTRRVPNWVGRPVGHNHAALMELGRQVTGHELLKLHQQDVLLSSGCMGHMLGFALPFLLAGVTTVMEDKICARTSMPHVTWDDLAKHKVTKALMTPLELRRYMQAAGPVKSCSVPFHRLVLAGQLVKTEQARETVWKVAREVVLGYWNTEVGFISTLLLTRRTLRHYREGQVGRLLEGVEVKMVPDRINIDRRSLLFRNQNGQENSDDIDVEWVFVKNPRTMGRSTRTMLRDPYAVGSDGFLDTGDVGVMDEESETLRLTGSRHTRLPMTGVFPELTEMTLRERVSGLREVLVVEVMVPISGPQVVAVLTIENCQKPHTVRQRCENTATKYLQARDRPAKYLVFDDLPTTPWSLPCRGLTGRLAQKDISEGHDFAWRWETKQKFERRCACSCCPYCAPCVIL